MSENDSKKTSSWANALAAVIAVAIGLLAALLSNQCRAVAAPEAVVFYGDSLTAAYGLDPELGYPALIQQKIDAAGMGDEFVVVPSAVSGETSAGGLSRLNWAMSALERSGSEVGVFMLALGANDGLRGQSTEAMAENLDAILGQVKTRHPEATLIVAGMLMPPNLGVDYQRDFQAAFAQVAEDNGAVLVPFLLENVAGKPELNLPDRIHPNAQGMQLIADNLWSVLEPILKQRANSNGDQS